MADGDCCYLSIDISMYVYIYISNGIYKPIQPLVIADRLRIWPAMAPWHSSLRSLRIDPQEW